MSGQPSPQQIAEARVESRGIFWYVSVDINAKGLAWYLHCDGKWGRNCGDDGLFLGEPTARAALAAAQERAGVHGRPEGATCGCVRLDEAITPAGGRVVCQLDLDPNDRRYVWRYGGIDCRLCRLGVPKPPVYGPSPLAAVAQREHSWRPCPVAGFRCARCGVFSVSRDRVAPCSGVLEDGPCLECNGSKLKLANSGMFFECPACEGTGKRPSTPPGTPGAAAPPEAKARELELGDVCDACGGTGREPEDPASGAWCACGKCEGFGRLKTVSVPAAELAALRADAQAWRNHKAFCAGLRTAKEQP